MYMDNVKILGFRAHIDSVEDMLNLINSFCGDGEIIQLLNGDSVAGKNHIFHGVNQAFLAFDRGVNLANDIGVEIVLRCSAQHQISKAFDILGLKKGDMNICAVVINCNDFDNCFSSFTRDDDVLHADEEYLKRAYDISQKELDSFSAEDIIIDRITKLTVDY